MRDRTDARLAAHRHRLHRELASAQGLGGEGELMRTYRDESTLVRVELLPFGKSACSSPATIEGDDATLKRP
jgi:hypothetical protein